MYVNVILESRRTAKHGGFLRKLASRKPTADTSGPDSPETATASSLA